MKTEDLKYSPVKIPSFFFDGAEESFNQSLSELKESNPELNSRVPELHSEALKTIEKNRDELEKLNVSIHENLRDPSKTKEAAIVSNHSFSEEISKRISQRTAETESRLRTQANSLQAEINTKIRREAEDYRNPDSILSYVRNLSSADRRKFLNQIVESKNLRTFAVIAEDEPFLSGLTNEDVEELKGRFIEKAFSNELEQINHLNSMADNLGKGYKATVHNMKVLESDEVKAIKQQQKRAAASREF